MKNHLKRIAAPKTWFIQRKARVFITRPNSGAHPLDLGIALGVVLRDILHLTATMSETRKMLHLQEVLIDGVRRRDQRYLVGLFDVISIPLLQKYYRVTFDSKGRLALAEIPNSEASFKVCKVIGKTVLSKGVIQYNCHDGKNFLMAQQAQVGDSLVIEVGAPLKGSPVKIKEVLSRKEGVPVFLTKGKYAGALGTLTSIVGKEAQCVVGGKDIQTMVSYLFVVGKNNPVITINPEGGNKTQ